jgi:hypothetical protein
MSRRLPPSYCLFCGRRLPWPRVICHACARPGPRPPAPRRPAAPTGVKPSSPRTGGDRWAGSVAAGAAPPAIAASNGGVLGARRLATTSWLTRT